MLTELERTVLICACRPQLMCTPTQALITRGAATAHLPACSQAVLQHKPLMPSLSALQFEVFGKVQGVYFRAGTVEQAQRLGLVGWVANTKPRGSVIGECQGPADRVAQMKEWLERVGSPGSRIERCDCKEQQVEQQSFSTFERRPNVSRPAE